MTDLFHVHHLLFGDDANTHHTVDDHQHDHSIGFDHDHTGFDQSGLFGDHTDVPWINFGPHTDHIDTEHGDAVANAAHAASGASDLPVGAFSNGVPWQQITPEAMHHDTDGDGVPDALDNHVGPGAL